MKSIRTKIISMVLLCVLIVALTIGAASIQSSKAVVDRDSSTIMQLQCESNVETINALLSRIAQSVGTLSDFAVKQLTDLPKFKTSSEYVAEYSEKLSEMAINAAMNTEGAMTVYIRYNPDFTEGTSGLFASRDVGSDSFDKLVPTDFSMYSSDDTAHVGWYYIPVNNGTPTWMDPYLNENIGVTMISYVVPLIKDGTTVGIVGMDIDFSVITSIIDDISIYENGHAFLTGANGDEVYRPENRTDDITKWKRLGSPLESGLQLTLTAPLSEINADANALIWRICLIALGGAIVAILIATAIVQSIVKPLRMLNRAAAEIAGGALDVEISCHSSDEVGTLADSLKQLVKRLCTYVSSIEETASFLTSIANGDLTAELHQEYAGEFAQIKDALLNISEALNRDFSQLQISATHIALGAEQVSHGAQDLSRGASEQSYAVESLSNGIEHLTGIAKTTVEGANNVHQLAGQAKASLIQNGESMGDMVNAIASIRDASDKIISMTRSVNDIAMQTNILALNASIEAARAGTAGKGFSIVAGEVKNLAIKSAGIADGINALVEEVGTAVSIGERIAGETETSVKGSAEGAAAVVSIMQGIVADCNEQLNASVQALDSIKLISDVVASTSSAAEEQAASSEELAGQAELLHKMTERFKMK